MLLAQCDVPIHIKDFQRNHIEIIGMREQAATNDAMYAAIEGESKMCIYLFSFFFTQCAIVQ